MVFVTLFGLLLAVLPSYTFGAQCYCTSEIRRSLYACMDTLNHVTDLYADMYDEPCFIKAHGVQTHGQWLAGIYNDQLVYMLKDYSVHEMPCSLKIGRSSYTARCPPTFANGATLNPPTTKPTTPTPPTTHKPTTQKPTVPTTPKPTPSTHRPTRTPTPSTTHRPVTIVTAQPGQTSNKCDFRQVLHHYKNKISAFHPDGMPCPMGGNPSESFLYEVCQPPFNDFNAWAIDKRVVDVCTTLLPGEPIGYYSNGQARGIMGVFVSCNGGNSFSIAMQACGSTVQIQDISATFFKAEYFYTFQW